MDQLVKTINIYLIWDQTFVNLNVKNTQFIPYKWFDCLMKQI